MPPPILTFKIERHGGTVLRLQGVVFMWGVYQRK
jgi:hypothetical protein